VRTATRRFIEICWLCSRESVSCPANIWRPVAARYHAPGPFQFEFLDRQAKHFDDCLLDSHNGTLGITDSETFLSERQRSSSGLASSQFVGHRVTN
jgi:hypothetical protein